jgi:hypothetical protein
MVLHHVINPQVLHAYGVVLLDYRSRHLLLEIVSLVTNFSVLFSHLFRGFSPAPAALLLFVPPPLQHLDLRHAILKIAQVPYLVVDLDKGDIDALRASGKDRAIFCKLILLGGKTGTAGRT